MTCFLYLCYDARIIYRTEDRPNLMYLLHVLYIYISWCI
jgi:hypothetical protein